MLQWSKIQKPEEITGEQNTKDMHLLFKKSLFGKVPSRGRPHNYNLVFMIAGSLEALAEGGCR